MQMIQRREYSSPLAIRSLALRDIHDLTCRHLFVRHFISTIKGLRYAFLTSEGETITQLGFEKSLTLVIDHAQIYEWKAICKHISYVQSRRIKQSSTSLHIYLTFEDQTRLHLRLVYKLRKKDVIFNETEQVLKLAKCNHEGIKIAHFTHTFEFYYLSFCLDNQKIPAFVINFFRNLMPEARQQIIEYFSQKYYLSIKTLESMIECVKEYNAQIIQALLHQPANRGMMRVQHKYASLMDTLQAWFISA